MCSESLWEPIDPNSAENYVAGMRKALLFPYYPSPILLIKYLLIFTKSSDCCYSNMINTLRTFLDRPGSGSPDVPQQPGDKAKSLCRKRVQPHHRRSTHLWEACFPTSSPNTLWLLEPLLNVTMAPDETSRLGSVCQAERTLTNRTQHSTAQTHFFPP